VLYISYGETDEWAHHGYYRSYLDAAHLVDNWIKEIWTFVQSDPQYKNKTTIFITTDHGRGDLKKEEVDKSWKWYC
jgi:bisphosphoglycerate-independent phosphoglycerate mutase (AlkP superfamily)